MSRISILLFLHKVSEVRNKNILRLVVIAQNLKRNTSLDLILIADERIFIATLALMNVSRTNNRSYEDDPFITDKENVGAVIAIIEAFISEA